MLKVSLEYVQNTLFPEVLNPLLGKVPFCVRDEHDHIRYGEAVGQPGRFLYEEHFPTTLYLWKLQIAPPDAARLATEERVRRRSEFLLIITMLATILVGIAFLFYATWKEQRANQLKSDFISNVSHELKTPLSLIRMFGELLALGKVKSPEKGKEYADIITREAERLSRLIDNVLDFARMERGPVAYEFLPGRLDEVVERSLDVYRHRLDREGFKLTTKIDSDLPETMLDENAMTLLLLNLLENAVKYGRGEIAVYLTRQGNRLRLVVGDQGPGIPSRGAPPHLRALLSDASGARHQRTWLRHRPVAGQAHRRGARRHRHRRQRPRARRRVHRRHSARGTQDGGRLVSERKALGGRNMEPRAAGRLVAARRSQRTEQP